MRILLAMVMAAIVAAGSIDGVGYDQATAPSVLGSTVRAHVTFGLSAGPGAAAASAAPAPGLVSLSPPASASRWPPPAPYRAPLAAGLRIVTPFRPPATPYGPGHLGVDVSAAAAEPVLAAGDGVVRFAGQVAGRGVVVLVHPDGISTEYEPVATVVVRGQRVVAGQRIARVLGRHRGCAPVGCLHWGARRGTTYLDPMTLLRPLGAVRLLPWA